MKSKTILSFLFSLIASIFMGTVLSAVLGTDPGMTITSTIGLSAVMSYVMPANVAGANLLVQMFAKDIQSKLYPDNSFYKNSIDDSAWINANKVNLPQSGAVPGVETNRTTLPATIAKRTDTAEDYTLDEFTTDPTLIQDSEALVVAYDKRQSVIMSHVDELNNKIAENFADIWFPTVAGNHMSTTGTTRSASAPSGTGTRKGVAKNDVIDMYNKMNRMDVPAEGRIAVIPADFLADILKIEEFVSAEKIGSANLVKGAVGMLCGFNIFVRSKVGIYTDADSKKSLSAAGAATDLSAALFYHPKFVRRAEGKVKVYSNLDEAAYYGSVFSAMVRAGGRIARTDEKGVLALVETFVS